MDLDTLKRSAPWWLWLGCGIFTFAFTAATAFVLGFTGDTWFKLLPLYVIAMSGFGTVLLGFYLRNPKIGVDDNDDNVE